MLQGVLLMVSLAAVMPEEAVVMVGGYRLDRGS